jgi:hypothetical protein
MSGYTPPTPDKVREFLRAHNLSGAQAAALAGLSGSNKIRAYTGGADPARMGYAVWFTLHAKTMLPEKTLEKIEAAMIEADAASVSQPRCCPPCGR